MNRKKYKFRAIESLECYDFCLQREKIDARKFDWLFVASSCLYRLRPISSGWARWTPKDLKSIGVRHTSVTSTRQFATNFTSFRPPKSVTSPRSPDYEDSEESRCWFREKFWDFKMDVFGVVTLFAEVMDWRFDTFLGWKGIALDDEVTLW